MTAFLIFLLLLPSLNTSDDDVISLIQNHEYHEAAELLEAMVIRDAAPEQVIQLMYVRHQLQDSFRILELHSEYNQWTNEDHRALFYAGAAMHRSGDLAGAAELLNRSLGLRDNFAAARIALGAVYEGQERWQEAQTAYLQLLEQSPRNIRFATQAARAMMRMQQYEDAYNLLKPMLLESPGVPEAHLNYTNALNALGNRKEAIRAAERATALFPENVRLLNQKARLYYGSGNYEGSAELWKRVYQLGSQRTDVMRNIALSLYALNNFDAALNWFEKVLEEDALDMGALFYASVIFRERNDLNRAGNLLDVLVEQQSTDFFRDSLIQLALVREEKQHYEQALKYYKLAADLQPNYGRTHYFIGFLYDHRMGKPGNAVKNYRIFLDSDDEDEALRAYARQRVRTLGEAEFFRDGRETDIKE
jgi:tetratricopeptide (TPR) repeat protein